MRAEPLKAGSCSCAPVCRSAPPDALLWDRLKVSHCVQGTDDLCAEDPSGRPIARFRPGPTVFARPTPSFSTMRAPNPLPERAFGPSRKSELVNHRKFLFWNPGPSSSYETILCFCMSCLHRGHRTVHRGAMGWKGIFFRKSSGARLRKCKGTRSFVVLR